MARHELFPETQDEEPRIRKGPETSRGIPSLELHGDPTTTYPDLGPDDGFDRPDGEPDGAD